jgi:hypothetical protein
MKRPEASPSKVMSQPIVAKAIEDRLPEVKSIEMANMATEVILDNVMDKLQKKRMEAIQKPYTTISILQLQLLSIGVSSNPL